MTSAQPRLAQAPAWFSHVKEISPAHQMQRECEEITALSVVDWPRKARDIGAQPSLRKAYPHSPNPDSFISMKTRSTLSKKILEQRARKRAERRQRELQALLESAGADRPSEDYLKNKPTRLTRRQHSEARRSTSIQVVIEVPARSGGSSVPITSVQLPGGDVQKDTLQVPNVENDQHMKSGISVQSSTKPDKTRRESSALKQQRKALRFTTNLDRKSRRRVRGIQKAIYREACNGTSRESVILKELRKTLKELNARRQSASASITPTEHRDTTPTTVASHQVESPILGPSLLRAEFLLQEQPGQARSLALENQTRSDKKVDTEEAMDSVAKTFPLTEECHHYTRRQDVDWDIQKYWDQRYSIFSLYDKGIRMTDDSWFGITPEPVANKVAEDLAAHTSASKNVLIDMFAGAGGNVIAFALSERWSSIIAIEKNPSVIACAQHNAAIYGVAEQITWINDDSFSYMSTKSSSIDPSKTVVFASPPWGGPGYTSDKIFNLNTMAPYTIKQIHQACKVIDSALYLPRTSDLRQIAELAPEGKKVEVVQYCMEGASKALVAYVPATV